MRRLRVWMTGVFLLATMPGAHAGGPLFVGSPTFGVDGQAFVWDNSHPIQYRTDSGALGGMDNATATAHMQQAFAKWTQVPTAALSVVNAGSILGLPNGHVSSVADFDTVAGSCSRGEQSPVVFDATGSIFSQLIGDAGVIGFTSACNLNPNGHIESALIVLTGGANLTTAQQDNVMMHEAGHFFGLDHSLVTGSACNGSTPGDIAALPVMFFQLTTQSGLTTDDKAWISTLYPSATYNQVYGTITGQVLFSDGVSGVQDVLVSAHPALPGTQLGEDRSIAVSSISGYRFTGSPGQPYTADYLACSPVSACPHGYYGNNVDGSQFGSRQTALLGWYEIPVPAGSYTVDIASPSYGGRIGPNNPIIPSPGPNEHWNAHESSTDVDSTTINCNVPQVFDAVDVKAGTPVNGIDIIIESDAADVRSVRDVTVRSTERGDFLRCCFAVGSKKATGRVGHDDDTRPLPGDVRVGRRAVDGGLWRRGEQWWRRGWNNVTTASGCAVAAGDDDVASASTGGDAVQRAACSEQRSWGVDVEQPGLYACGSDVERERGDQRNADDSRVLYPGEG